MTDDARQPIDPEVRIGHVHLKVADLEMDHVASLSFEFSGWTFCVSIFSSVVTSLSHHCILLTFSRLTSRVFLSSRTQVLSSTFTS